MSIAENLNTVIEEKECIRKSVRSRLYSSPVTYPNSQTLSALDEGVQNVTTECVSNLLSDYTEVFLPFSSMKAFTLKKYGRDGSVFFSHSKGAVYFSNKCHDPYQSELPCVITDTSGTEQAGIEPYTIFETPEYLVVGNYSRIYIYKFVSGEGYDNTEEYLELDTILTSGISTNYTNYSSDNIEYAFLDNCLYYVSSNNTLSRLDLNTMTVTNLNTYTNLRHIVAYKGKVLYYSATTFSGTTEGSVDFYCYDPQSGNTSKVNTSALVSPSNSRGRFFHYRGDDKPLLIYGDNLTGFYYTDDGITWHTNSVNTFKELNHSYSDIPPEWLFEKYGGTVISIVKINPDTLEKFSACTSTYGIETITYSNDILLISKITSSDGNRDIMAFNHECWFCYPIGSDVSKYAITSVSNQTHTHLNKFLLVCKSNNKLGYIKFDLADWKSGERPNNVDAKISTNIDTTVLSSYAHLLTGIVALGKTTDGNLYFLPFGTTTGLVKTLSTDLSSYGTDWNVIQDCGDSVVVGSTLYDTTTDSEGDTVYTYHGLGSHIFRCTSSGISKVTTYNPEKPIVKEEFYYKFVTTMGKVGIIIENTPDGGGYGVDVRVVYNGIFSALKKKIPCYSLGFLNLFPLDDYRFLICSVYEEHSPNKILIELSDTTPNQYKNLSIFSVKCGYPEKYLDTGEAWSSRADDYFANGFLCSFDVNTGEIPTQFLIEGSCTKDGFIQDQYALQNSKTRALKLVSGSYSGFSSSTTNSPDVSVSGYYALIKLYKNKEERL